MYKWDRSTSCLDISAQHVISLFRSMRDVQLVLPGLPIQQATAYLCQYQKEQSFATVVAFLLQKSQQLAFYRSDPEFVDLQKAEKMFEKGLIFVESMGFLMTDLDIHLLNVKDRSELWSSLPLMKGLPASESVQMEKSEAATLGTNPPQTGPAKQNIVSTFDKAELMPPQKEPEVPVVDLLIEDIADEESEQESEIVGELLAAVEALRSKQSSLLMRNKTIKPLELKKRCRELQATIGRILSSL